MICHSFRSSSSDFLIKVIHSHKISYFLLMLKISIFCDSNKSLTVKDFLQINLFFPSSRLQNNFSETNITEVFL